VVQFGREEFEIVVLGGDVLDDELVFVPRVVLADEHEDVTPIRACEGVEHPVQS
jgi:hypothetical protein